ncbi:MAG: methyltransferase domain-containing protein [Oscillospiraceae bacterium]|nr:methyltransferase domain-containing protein [Oscillospiraceae bacterium]
MKKIGDVLLNDKYWKSEYDDTDSKVGSLLLEYLSQTKNPLEIISMDNRWPVLYHMSPIRKNIVEWYPFKKNAEILEIGSESGVLTEVLCRNAKSVTCIEQSKQLSVVNATRNQNFSNLEIIIGSMKEIQLEQCFDYITLIGYLEYVRCFEDSKNPFVSFLKEIKKYLKKDGKILLAVQNKFGLKYWAGHAEDHTGEYFASIEGYNREKEKADSFSKNELKKIISEAGYQCQDFYYPFPEYKFPQQIFSDKFLPKEDDIICSRDSYDYDKYQTFDETAAFRNIIQSGYFDIFANSFFVELSQ